ncbi:DUF971 domain-containing protein [Marinobacter sp. 2_MG-2023]|uniref:DUF971 domain-containing protein n=1 Tax=Marinobacter sp. 2_MG-2023 TaxID=3062679 RepID=UPI0026E41EE2|nr:DUF971 domain-containing protein [Marinobacter sp. 2_MG-2023]MDO6443012.1 DUF971 domain-containing protein [Marinobacter sp. 2_MG-2023]
MARHTPIEPPREVRLKRKLNTLELSWPDGLTTQLSCLLLRKSCACSQCTQAKRTGRLSLIDADIHMTSVELSGVSGLQFHFSDGHYRGLYPWAFLRELSEQVA